MYFFGFAPVSCFAAAMNENNNAVEKCAESGGRTVRIFFFSRSLFLLLRLFLFFARPIILLCANMSMKAKWYLGRINLLTTISATFRLMKKHNFV